ncbi:hypothetical protein SAMN05444722_1712 [Rhodovulum sp. ES.010]|uniref:hypothetical protein n=1 Tax=Rhodovulum sp. ES.010 TaxID=1882821 RepID=UPI0009265278|nr:hypothetical protein [Rhodovulum sp. ES.010]SIO36902.1 hypothetical protein SAMN05444722_1712 [Rhodovulum sp. ES.010]
MGERGVFEAAGRVKRVLTAAAVGVAVASSAGVLHASDCKVSLAQFGALRTGMSYAEAVAVLGCDGVVMSHMDMAGIVTTMFMWEGRGFGANMNAMFQNDALVSKAQFGLR